MWLVGMMGSGKTRAGRIAATRLGVGFTDTDEEVERTASQPISRIWDTLGESAFRRLEHDVVAGLAGFEGIVATGGGVILDEGNRRVMARGTVVWLLATPETLADRVSLAERPLIDDRDPVSSLRGLLESREAIYRKIAHHHIDTEGLVVEDVAHRIEVLWRG